MRQVVTAEKNIAVIDDNNLGMAGFPEGIEAYLDPAPGKNCCGGAVFPVEKVTFIPRLLENHGHVHAPLPGAYQLLRNLTRLVVGKFAYLEEIAGDDNAGIGSANSRKESIAVLPVYQQGCTGGVYVG